MAASSSDRSHYRCCFDTWLTVQRQDLEELLHGAASYPDDPKKLHALVEKNVQHFEEYRENRSMLAQQDAPAFLCLAWCNTLENSLLWIGGCRPSLAIRLVYSLCGSELDARLDQYLSGERKGTISEVSGTQLNQINSLHMKILREEERLTSRMASLQEDIVDEPLASIAKELSHVGEPSETADKVLEGHALTLGRMLLEADNLRLSTLKRLVEILTTLQAVDLLASSKKLHLSLHEWGKRWNRGRSPDQGEERGGIGEVGGLLIKGERGRASEGGRGRSLERGGI
ncbi:hypothetical protein CRG98_046576 [Punica granatum]|nr:hypothetical protein CRG98_046576 [Punica granatum]